MGKKVFWSAASSLLLLFVATCARPANAQSYNPKSNETLYYAPEDTAQTQPPVGSLTVLCDGSRWTLGMVTTNVSRERLGCDPLHQTTPVTHEGMFFYYECVQTTLDGQIVYYCTLRFF